MGIGQLAMNGRRRHQNRLAAMRGFPLPIAH